MMMVVVAVNSFSTLFLPPMDSLGSGRRKEGNSPINAQDLKWKKTEFGHAIHFLFLLVKVQPSAISPLSLCMHCADMTCIF